MVCMVLVLRGGRRLGKVSLGYISAVDSNPRLSWEMSTVDQI